MADQETLRFYDAQARHYKAIRARPIQVYTDKLERAALERLVEASSDILDLGCGEGRLTRWVAKQKQMQGRPFSIWGADFSPQMVEFAKRFNKNLPASYKVGDAMALDFEDDAFDLVVSCTAPNNFPNIDTALGEIHRVLRPGGIFFATIINSDEAARFARYFYYAPYYIWKALQRSIMGEAGYHRILFSHDDLARLLAGRFDILELTGMRVIPDFVPEFPLNIWPPLFPLMQAIIEAGERIDRRLERGRYFSRHARFHHLVARAVK